MTRNILLFAAGAILVLSAASCAKTETAGPVSLRIAASFEEDPSTRTVLTTTGAVWWSPFESVHVFCGDRHAEFSSHNDYEVSTVFFDGQLEGVDASVLQTYVAVYPYQAESTFDGTGVTATLPDAQRSKSGSFCDGMALSVARTTAVGSANDIPMDFLNVCSGLKFSMVHSGVTSVSFRGNNDEDIAGKVRITFDGNGTPVVSNVIDGKKEITLTFEKNDPGNVFDTDAWVYLTIIPQTFEKGFTVTFRTSSTEGTYVYDKSVTFKRSVWKRAERIDKDVHFFDPNSGIVSTVTLHQEDVSDDPSYPTLTFPGFTYSTDFIEWSEEDGHVWHGTEDGCILLHNVAPLLLQYCDQNGLTFNVLDDVVSVDGNTYHKAELVTPIPYIIFIFVQNSGPESMPYELVVSNAEYSMSDCSITLLVDDENRLLFLIQAGALFLPTDDYFVFPYTTQQLVTREPLSQSVFDDIISYFAAYISYGAPFFDFFNFEDTVVAQRDLDYSPLR